MYISARPGAAVPRGLGAVRRIPVPRMIARGKTLGLGGTCNTNASCCGPIGRTDPGSIIYDANGNVISAHQITAADCKGYTICDPSCMDYIANPVCHVPGVPDDPSCAPCTPGVPNRRMTNCMGVPGLCPTPKWDPTKQYQNGDVVLDTCGQEYEAGPNGTWFSTGSVAIGCGKVGITGCVGPLGTVSMNPNWLQQAVASTGIDYSLAPGAAPATGSPSTGSPSTQTSPAPGMVPAAGSTLVLPTALTQNVQVGGTSVPAWMLAAAAAAAAALFLL